MGLHSKSDKAKRKLKYQEQFIRTAENKRKRIEKQKRKADERKSEY